MELMIGIFFFVFGTIIGSFLNVIILRYNTGKGIGGRSQCFSCSKELRWFELVPVISYLVLRGKCARCKSKFSPQYLLVELLTGFVFLALFLKFQTLSLEVFYYAIIFCLLIVILVYDLRHKIIPDEMALVFAALGFIGMCIRFSSTVSFHTPDMWAILAGPILAAPFALLWLVSNGRWMGLGDAKLAWGMGWMLGLSNGISAIVLAFWIGALISLLIIAVQKNALFQNESKLTMKSEVPFAPFLILGLALVFFLGFHVIDIGGFL